MTKKLILALIVFTTLFSLTLFSPKMSLAQCSPPANNVGQCPRGTIHCNLSNGGVQCCAQIAGGNSCSQVPGSVQATIPPTNLGGNSGGSTSDVLCQTGGINTAIGCLQVLGGQDQFLGAILKWAVGVGGGIAFLLIVYAGFMIMSAAGSPDRLKAGQELLTSAISGLILLVFSIFILKFIGVDILGLDSFGFGKSP